MNRPAELDTHLTEQGVLTDLQRQPLLFHKLAENALTVAQSLRENYFKNTAHFVGELRRAMHNAAQGKLLDPVLSVQDASDLGWSDLQGEVVTFIDGGIGRVQISSQVPILLRVGSYSVRIGERQMREREHFGYYPIILGDLEGGSKERRDFPDIVRIIAELLGGLSALDRTRDLRMLMFHGPLIYTVHHYMGHSPFTEPDIDLFLRHYAPDPDLGLQIKEGFLREAQLDIYPQMTSRSDEWVRRRLFEPLAWIAYLYRRLIREASQRTPIPIIAGVVERSDLREFLERILLERVFRILRRKGQSDYFNRTYGRADLTSPRALLDRFAYTDTLLLAMLLHPGQASEPWQMTKEYDGLRRADLVLPGEADAYVVNFTPLQPGQIGFPHIQGCYVHVTENTAPIRVEVFNELGDDQIAEAARRVYLYSRLLPGYGFPVGLDIVDKYAHVPAWLTNAYSKQIKHHLGVSLQRGEINDAEMRRLLVQAIYITHRDWLFRPEP